MKNEYRDELEKLKIEFASFMNLSEKASWTNNNKIALKARKQSILLRALIKKFRKTSLAHEKYLKNNSANDGG